MPRIKTDTKMIDGKEYRRNFKVDSSGRFTVNFPSHAGAIVGCGTEIAGANLQEVMGTWNRSADAYEAAKTEREKIILFSFNATATIFDEAQDRVVFKENDVGFCDGTGLDFWWETCIEERVIHEGGSARYLYYHEDGSRLNVRGNASEGGHGNQANDSCRLAWTPEREAFFQKIESGLNSLIMALASLQEDKVRLLAFADGKLALPLPAEVSP